MNINRLLYISIIVIMMIPHVVFAEEYGNTLGSPHRIEFKERIELNRWLDSMVRAEISHQVDEEIIGLKIKIACTNCMKDIENGMKDIENEIKNDVYKHIDWMLIGFGALITLIVFLLGWLLPKRRMDDLEERLKVIESNANKDLQTKYDALNKQYDELQNKYRLTRLGLIGLE